MPEKKSHLLVPLDGSIPPEQPLEVASALADLMDTDIHVLFVSHETVAAEAVVARVRMSKAWQARVRTHQAEGHAAPCIRDVARALPASAIPLSSHGATGNLDALAGHVTLGVLTDPPCPVYVVRSALSARSQVHRLRHVRRILVPLDGSEQARRRSPKEQRWRLRRKRGWCCSTCCAISPRRRGRLRSSCAALLSGPTDSTRDVRAIEDLLR